MLRIRVMQRLETLRVRKVEVVVVVVGSSSSSSSFVQEPMDSVGEVSNKV